MKTLILTAAALLAFAGTASAHTSKAAVKATALVCPVTGEKIGTVDNSYNHESYHGKTYYFCCPSCKPRFDKNPAKVITDAAHGKYQPM